MSSVAPLVPRLAYHLVDKLGVGESHLHEAIDGTLLSADISGFTRLTEELADRGREGAELITAAVNSCFYDLIGTGEWYGGDVIKFGGDAVLMLFTGDGHQSRAAEAGQEMQFALRRNTHARHHQLSMTVGVGHGPLDAMVIGDRYRDLLLGGPATTETLRLEDAAENGQVLVTDAVAAAVVNRQHSSGVVIHQGEPFDFVDVPEVTVDTMAGFVAPSLLERFIVDAEIGEFRQAAFGFVAIGAVDDYLAESGGEATARALDVFIDGVHQALDRTGSTLLHSDSAMGGIKLLIGAGVPRAVDAPADALLHAALEIQKIESPFVIKQGLNIGTVYAGFLGAPHRRTYTLMSDAVNTAARMLGPGGPGDIVAVDAVARRARSQVLGPALNDLQVKGKSTTINAVLVEGLALAATVDQPDAATVFAGRDQETDQIRDALSAGSGITIFGPAGSGKTRLRNEAIVSDGSLAAAGGRYLSSSPYGAFWSVARELVNIESNLGPLPAGTALADRLAGAHPGLVDLAALIAPVFGAEASFESEQVRAIEPEFRRDVLHSTITQLLAEQQPSITAIIIEDTQWLDDASVELIDHLAAVSSEHGWVVVRSLRSSDGTTDVPTEPVGVGTVDVVLGPLDDPAVQTIISAASDRPLLQHELDRLVSRAQGNPLFALELAAAAGRPGEEIPESIEELITARIDRLPAAQRQAVRLASVLGARFALSTFRALVEATDFDVPTDLGEIDAIFNIDDDAIQFRELLYRDVAYASLAFAQRKRLHRLVGEYLEATSPDVGAISALLSQHFFAAGDRRRCWVHSITAAQRAERQYSPGDAIVLYNRALDFAPRGIDAAERSAAQLGLGRSLVAAGSLEDAHMAFGKARKSSADEHERQGLLCMQADCRNRQGRFSDALRTYSRVLSEGEVSAEHQITALIGRGSVLYKLARHRESYDLGHQALKLAQDHSDRQGEGRAWNLISVNGERLESPDRSQSTNQALVIFREIGSLSEEAEVRNNIGVTAQLEGDLDGASDAYRASLELKQRVGDLSGAAMVQMNLAEVELDRHSTAGVDELLAACIAVFDRSGFAVGVAYSQGLRGRCALLTGDPHKASELLQSASAVFMGLNAEGYAAEMELLLIDAYIGVGDIDAAKELVEVSSERLTRDIFDNPDAVRARLEVLAGQLAN